MSDRDVAADLSVLIAAMDPRLFKRAPLALKALFQTWIVVAFFLVAFYECNLRANLVVVQYEKPIDTEQDILDRGVELHISRVTFISFEVVF